MKVLKNKTLTPKEEQAVLRDVKFSTLDLQRLEIILSEVYSKDVNVFRFDSKDLMEDLIGLIRKNIDQSFNQWASMKNNKGSQND